MKSWGTHVDALGKQEFPDTHELSRHANLATT